MTKKKNANRGCPIVVIKQYTDGRQKIINILLLPELCQQNADWQQQQTTKTMMICFYLLIIVRPFDDAARKIRIVLMLRMRL